MKKIGVALILLTLAGCGSKGDTIIFDTRLGPRTEDQVKELPSGLAGDAASARYSQMPSTGKGMQNPDGKEDSTGPDQ